MRRSWQSIAIGVVLLASLGAIAVLAWRLYSSTASPVAVSRRVEANRGAALQLGRKIRLDLPPGALAADAVARLEELSPGQAPASPWPEARAVSPVFRVEAGEARLIRPITLEIHYEPQQLPEEALADLIFPVFWDEAQGRWRIASQFVIDRDRRVVVVTSDHLSIWQLWVWDLAKLVERMVDGLARLSASPAQPPICNRIPPHMFLDFTPNLLACLEHAEAPGKAILRVANNRSYGMLVFYPKGVEVRRTGGARDPLHKEASATLQHHVESFLLGRPDIGGLYLSPGEEAELIVSFSEPGKISVWSDLAFFTLASDLAIGILKSFAGIIDDEVLREAAKCAVTLLASKRGGLEPLPDLPPRILMESVMDALIQCASVVDPALVVLAKPLRAIKSILGYMRLLVATAEALLDTILTPVPEVEKCPIAGMGCAVVSYHPPVLNLKGKIVFARCQTSIQSSIAFEGCDLYAINPDGSGLTNLTRTPHISEFRPSVAPDGTWLVFNCRGAANGVCRMRSEGLVEPLPIRGSDAALSPDGRRIAYVGHDGIYVASLDGSGARRVSRLFSRPGWSPDGRWLAFSCNSAICAARSDGSEERVIFDTPGGDCCPVWSPDGRWIAIWQGSNLLIIRPGQRWQETGWGFASGYYGENGHAWSPDGERIVFATYMDPVSGQVSNHAQLWVAENVLSTVGESFPQESYQRLAAFEDSDCLTPVWVP